MGLVLVFALCFMFYNVWNCYISWFFPDSVTFFMLFLLLLFFGYGFCSCSLFIWLTGWLRCLLYLFSVLILHFNCLFIFFCFVVAIVLIIVFVVAVCLFAWFTGYVFVPPVVFLFSSRL